MDKQTADANEAEPYVDLFEGFNGYCTPSTADYQALFRTGLIVLDTNTILNLYRFEEKVRDDIFGVLDVIRDRLWMPHQVAREFWRNRESSPVQFVSEVKDALKSIDAARGNAVASIRNLANRLSLDVEKKNSLVENLDKSFLEIRTTFEVASGEQELEEFRDSSKDQILLKVSDLFRGKVSRAPSSEEWQCIEQEGARRLNDSVPPGYKDKGKFNGDYAIWHEVIKEAGQRRADVLIVTGDKKEDWWREIGGKTAGPRLEMVDELWQKTGSRLYLMTPQSLLINARELLNVAVSDSSVQGARETVDLVGNSDRSAIEAHQKPYADRVSQIALTRFIRASYSLDPRTNVAKITVSNRGRWTVFGLVAVPVFVNGKKPDGPTDWLRLISGPAASVDMSIFYKDQVNGGETVELLSRFIMPGDPEEIGVDLYFADELGQIWCRLADGTSGRIRDDDELALYAMIARIEPDDEAFVRNLNQL
ncbi:PIN-like domain-containing protein [Amycolatopsis mediterranei]|uniref:PIN-like domain-containing protein n=1 Tax=Amycolatopsis mediterranei TaxID=33910 RepID=UPI00343A75DA